MIYAFTSNQDVRYTQDALNALAYPPGHIVRFRYRKTHVSPAVASYETDKAGVVRLERLASRSCIIIFLEGIRGTDQRVDPEQPFSVYPLRGAEIVRMQWNGEALYVDISLKGYISYRTGKTTDVARYDQITQELRKLPYHPLPQSRDGKGFMWLDGQRCKYEKGKGGTGGYFFADVAENSDGYVSWPMCPSGDRTEEEAWESVVDILAKSKDFREAMFFRVSGIYRRLGRGFDESNVEVDQGVAELEYCLPMGEVAIMKVMCYVPMDGGGRGTLSVRSEGDGFAGISPRSIHISSRYNEERVILASKRVLDNVQSPIEVVPEDPKAVAPRVFFLTRVTVPHWIPWVPVGVLGLAAVFLSIGPDLLESVGGQGSFLANCKSTLSLLSKGLGGLCTAIAAYLAFRKMPVGK